MTPRDDDRWGNDAGAVSCDLTRDRHEVYPATTDVAPFNGSEARRSWSMSRGRPPGVTFASAFGSFLQKLPSSGLPDMKPQACPAGSPLQIEARGPFLIIPFRAGESCRIAPSAPVRASATSASGLLDDAAAVATCLNKRTCRSSHLTAVMQVPEERRHGKPTARERTRPGRRGDRWSSRRASHTTSL